MLSSTCYEEKTKPITINNYNKQSISISIPIAIPTTPDNNSNYIDEYSLNCNNFNPNKMSPPDIWKNRLKQRLENYQTITFLKE